ncbi:rubredoxin [Emticicia sp. BO119]|uniref:rubredoxin n=1 Tax=Emticicia sp. BO119 TaxID=2757768 RepID=UPI0015F05F6F|nr:rubredoxin [Emticicia sp. BO119]MBA4849064.1 rubredoxin [Emticicia sp. BO119]
MRDYYLIRVNFKGGIVSPAEMKDILSVAAQAQVESVRFGLRHQMLLYVPHSFGKPFGKAMEVLSVDFEVDNNQYPNIVSSYVAEEVFQKGNWLTEGIYKDILDTFEYRPQLKINISDADQSFSPFFSGHLNFIASPTPNFWYLYVRIPKSNQLVSFKRLVFSNEIAKVSQYLEDHILIEKHTENKEVETLLENLPVAIAAPIETELVPARFTLPYYEGFNRYGKKTWLGIYRRNETFSVEFLMKICKLCQETKIGEICLTPFKSLIIKGIQEADRWKWSNVLSEFNINVRHAANELNWQIEDDSDTALQLKAALVRRFDAIDLRTFGLCFGIKTRPRTEVYASIMLMKRRFRLFNLIPLHSVYDISYTEDFNPNGRTKKYFSQGIWRFNLDEQLRRCVLKYNNLIAENQIKAAGLKDDHKAADSESINTKIVHQCPCCFTIYDEDFGDLLNSIPIGVSFENLSDNYTCPTCETGKNEFKKLEMEINLT